MWIGGLGAKDALVAPVPDESSLKETFFAVMLPVFSHDSTGIAHGMTVLALDERALFSDVLSKPIARDRLEAAVG